MKTMNPIYTDLNEAIETMDKFITEAIALEKRLKNEYGFTYEEDLEAIEEYEKLVSDWELSDAWGIIDEDAPELFEKYNGVFEAHYSKAPKFRKMVDSFDYEEEARLQAGDAKYDLMMDK